MRTLSISHLNLCEIKSPASQYLLIVGKIASTYTLRKTHGFGVNTRGVGGASLSSFERRDEHCRRRRSPMALIRVVVSLSPAAPMGWAWVGLGLRNRLVKRRWIGSG